MKVNGTINIYSLILFLQSPTIVKKEKAFNIQ